MDVAFHRTIRITGEGGRAFLQGLLTQDMISLAADEIRFAALLSPQGKVLYEMGVAGEAVARVDAEVDAPSLLLDTVPECAEALLALLRRYRLRAPVGLELSDIQVFFHPSDGVPDPRHPALARRVYAPDPPPGALSIADMAARRFACGVPECTRDYPADSLTALDVGLHRLNAVSFTKGCYVGQEITARMHYKSILRKGCYQLWDGATPLHLAILRHDAVVDGRTMLDGREVAARPAPDGLA